VKSLLLNINPDPGNDARVQAAIALVKARGGHITCLQCLVPPTVAGDPGAGLTIAEMMEAEEEVARKLQDEIEVRLDQAGVQWTWVRIFAEAGAAVIEHARLADLILLGTGETHPPVSAVAPHARTPVLAVPPEDRAFEVAAPALVAWNGSAAAANALRAAVPLLHAAASVQILAVDRDDDEFPAARASEYLSWHAIKSDIHWRHGEGRPVAATILEFAGLFGAGLVVAGAFGHNRLREMLLGSVTRALLKDSPRPLFLSH
jgi:nucleotide-binding universal stress UspA family protein